MSYAGLTTAQLTPELLQQMQDQQRRQSLAQTLMSNNANPNTPNAGIANAGSDIAGALAYKRMGANALSAAQNAYGAANGAPPGNLNPVTFQPQNVGSVVGNPSLGGRAKSFFSGLFGMGGGT